MEPINLDCNATTTLLPVAAEAMARVEAEAPGNPSSAHSIGRKARRFLEDAREKVAHLLQALPEEVIFTSGATEANNLAIFGLVGETPGCIFASRIEHPCVIEPLKSLEKRGFTVDWLPVTPRGTIEPGEVKSRVTSQTRLVTVMLANHETGAINDVKAMAAATPFHCDAAQAVGKIPVSFRDLGVTSLSLSAHKFGGPKGAGALLLRKGTPLKPLYFGGFQQHGHRPGTEAVPLAVGLAAALEHAINNLDATASRWKKLRQDFIGRLQAEASPIVVNGDGLPNTVNVSFPGCRSDLMLMALDLAGVACSTGSACTSGSLLPSPVLQAMNVSDDVLRSAMRFSFGRETFDLDDAIERIVDGVANARR